MVFFNNSQVSRNRGDAVVSSSEKSETGERGTSLCRCDRGFTLIEIILTVALISIVGMVGVQYITSLAQVNQANSEQSRLMEEANIAMGFVARELREGDVATDPVRCGPAAVDCVVGTVYQQVTFDKIIENPIDSLRRDTNGNDIQYALNGTTLERTSSGVTTQVAADMAGLSITEIFPNLYRIQMTMAGPGGGNFALETAVRVRSTINPPTPPSYQVALLVKDPAGLHPDKDVPLRDYIQNTLGHTVTLKDDDNATPWPDIGTYNAVVISSSTKDKKVGWLKSQTVGVLTLHGKTFNELSLGTGGHDRSPNAPQDTDVSILDNTHYITQFTQSLPNPLTVSTTHLDTGHIRGWNNNDVKALAIYAAPPDNDKAKILYVDAGGQLLDGSPAAARRVFFGARHFANLNTDGQELFKRSLEWVTQ